MFDCRHDLGDPSKGEAAYREGHIAGALHAHLDRDLSGAKTGRNGRHPLPDADRLAEWLGRSGLRNTDQVVAYDEGSGVFAARLWWMLRWTGHDAVAVLDGGLAAWIRQGRPLTRAVDHFARSEFHAVPNETMSVDTESVLRNLSRRPGKSLPDEAGPDEKEFQLVDARGANRFAGVDETIDPVGGHIPGALNRPYMMNLSADGLFKPAAELRSEFDRLLSGRASADIVNQCGSGVTACHNLLAMEIAGLSGARLYPGSWSEWCSDPERPVAVGALP